jgi:hypothetical protein
MTESGLANELKAEADDLFAGGRTNNVTDIACSIGAILGSFLAAVLAATDDVYPAVTAGVAALPGLCASLQRVIDFRGRSAWYFLKSAQLSSIARSVRFAMIDDATAAAQWNEVDKAMEERWAEFVRAGTAPPATDHNL